MASLRSRVRSGRRGAIGVAAHLTVLLVLSGNAQATGDPSPTPLFSASLQRSIEALADSYPMRVTPAVATTRQLKSRVEPIATGQNAVRCRYELVCTTGSPEFLRSLGISLGDTLGYVPCSDSAECPDTLKQKLNGVCFYWVFIGCGETHLLGFMSSLEDCLCAPLTTMPGSLTCDRSASCPGVYTCTGEMSCPGYGTTMCGPSPTCAPNQTCYGGTCIPEPTCFAQYPSCIGPTCGGVATCVYTCFSTQSTCQGFPTCQAATCAPLTTCGTQTTCDSAPTCSAISTCPGFATCGNATCPPTNTCGDQATCATVSTCPGYTTCYQPTCGSTWTTCGGQATCATVPTCPAYLTCNNSTCPGCECPHQGDLNADGDDDAVDVAMLIDFVFGSAAAAAPTADSLCLGYDLGDLDCDRLNCLLDVVMLIDATWFGGIEFCDPCQSATHRVTSRLSQCPFEKAIQTAPASWP